MKLIFILDKDKLSKYQKKGDGRKEGRNPQFTTWKHITECATPKFLPRWEGAKRKRPGLYDLKSTRYIFSVLVKPQLKSSDVTLNVPEINQS